MNTDTIPLSLNGCTDLPPGKIANVVTYFERSGRAPAAAPRNGLSVRQVAAPATAWYRRVYSRIGLDWLWISAVLMPEERLAADLADPATLILTLLRDQDDIGLAELKFSAPAEVEIVVFGVIPEAVGTGAASVLMRAALAAAFRPGVSRVWLHTCTFDHPAAVPFYLRHGFRAYKYAIEVIDDPRLQGILPPTAAPHVPLIRPNAASVAGSRSV